MELSSELVSQFVKATNDTEPTSTESTVYGTVVEYEGKKYVKLDGSDQLTPVETTVSMSENEKVIVNIKNHTATVTGNLSDPSASGKNVEDLSDKIDEFEIIIADKVLTDEMIAEIAKIGSLEADNATIKETLTANSADISELEANVADINTLKADKAEVEELVATKVEAEIADLKFATIEDLDATNADIHNLEADYGDFKQLSTEKFTAVEGDISELESKQITTEQLDAKYATITNLNATNANVSNLSAKQTTFESTTTNEFTAVKADITELESNQITTEQLDAKYAQIDFSNIGEAAVEKLFSDSGIIEALVMSEGKVTGRLVGVTIIGDLIEANTLKADRLVIQGEDGLYYKLNVNALGEATASADEKYQNGLDGSVIVAQSITAEKVAVDDLVAFNATIGGLHLTDGAIYSGVKESISNTTDGFYLDKDGQLNVGGSSAYVKIYKGSDNKRHVEIKANSIVLTSGTNVETALNNTASAVSQAQSTADTAQAAASDAIRAADTAQVTANGAQVSVDALEESTTAQLSVLEDSINANVTATNALTTRVTNVEATANGLSSTVSSVQTNLNNLSIGGTNLQLGSRNWDSTALTSKSAVGISGNELSIAKGGQAAGTRIACTLDEEFTVSVDVKTVTAYTGRIFFVEFLNASNVRQGYIWLNGSVTTDWQRVAITVKASDMTVQTGGDLSTVTKLAVQLRSVTYANTYRFLKVEKGNKPTSWSPAPEDTESAISDAQSTADSAMTYALRKTAVDLSDTTVYDENTYYPVMGDMIPKEGYRQFQVNVQLNSGTNPSWSTHANGFACNLTAKMKNHGYGTVPYAGLGWIEDNTYLHCERMPAYITQHTQSGRPFLYLRGGGKYYVYTDYECTWTPITTSWTSSNITHAPVTDFTQLGNLIHLIETRTQLTQLSDRITANVTETTNLGTRISTVEQTASGLTVRLTSMTEGSINLIRESKDFTLDSTRVNGWNKYNGNWTFAQDTDGFMVASVSNTGLTANVIHSLYSSKFPVKTGDKVVFSAWIKVDDYDAWEPNKVPWIFEVYDSAGTRVQFVDTGISYANSSKSIGSADGGKWVYFYAWYTVSHADAAFCSMRLTLFRNGSVHYKKCKVEFGTYPTAWSAAPEDMATNTDLATAQSTAAKTATNFLSFDSTNGLQVGNKSSGSWSGFRSQMTSSAFNILNAAGAVLASYGASLIELGKNMTNAVISLCGGKGKISYGAATFNPDRNELRLEGPDITIRGDNEAIMEHVDWNTTAGTGSKRAVSVNSTEVGMYAGYSSDLDDDGYGEWTAGRVSLSIDTTAVTSQYSSMATYQHIQAEQSLTLTSLHDSVNIYTDYGGLNIETQPATFEYAININGRAILANQILWSGASHMNANQTAMFDGLISSQPHGAVFIFSYYDNANQRAGDHDFSCHFVPKELISKHGGCGIGFPYFPPTFNSTHTACKYLYVSDHGVNGYSGNTSSGTGTNSIAYNNANRVLRYVIGV